MKSANPTLSEMEGKKKGGIYTEWVESSPINTELEGHAQEKKYIYNREKLFFKKWQQYIKGTSLSSQTVLRPAEKGKGKQRSTFCCI